VEPPLASPISPRRPTAVESRLASPASQTGSSLWSPQPRIRGTVRRLTRLAHKATLAARPTSMPCGSSPPNKKKKSTSPSRESPARL
jgi:hypothetical protein